jgi:hypothetical protein
LRNSEEIQSACGGVVRTALQNGSDIFFINDVLYVPKLRLNLTSVSQLVNRQIKTEFDLDGCEIYLAGILSTLPTSHHHSPSRPCL